MAHQKKTISIFDTLPIIQHNLHLKKKKDIKASILICNSLKWYDIYTESAHKKSLKARQMYNDTTAG